jgi:plastocyanin
MYSLPSLLVALAATAAAKTIVITAGQGGFVFSPDTVTADVNDVLEYHFVGSIHSVASGDHASPCAQSSTGFYSGKIDAVSLPF